ncbi:MAG TPA: hypothetical protein VKB78_05245 [Pirellulales bacterium]|nr:hypothetical protein [Pirellulales bacterium]
MPKTMMLVFSKPISAESEAAYNDWYSNKHLPDLTRVPGLVSATRYKLDKSVEPMPGITGDPRGYLAVYEIEGETPSDLERFAQTLRQALADGVADISPHLDMVDISASFAIPITDRLTPQK